VSPIPLFGTGREVDLLRLYDGPPRHRGEIRRQNERAEGIWRRLRRPDVPGVILGDEVGKGKTYIALGVAYAWLERERRLQPRRQPRILILTHNHTMADQWCGRWKLFCERATRKKDLSPDYPAEVFPSLADFEDAARMKRSERMDGEREPTLWIASYEKLKKFLKREEEVDWLRELLQHVYAVKKCRFSEAKRRRLIKAIVPSVHWGKRRFRHRHSHIRVDLSDARPLLRRCLDTDGSEPCWQHGAVQDVREWLQEQEGDATALGRPFDLLIIDEAHKMEGTRRHAVLTKLLHKKFHKAIWVTATPFALSVDEFRRRLVDFRHAIDTPQEYEKTIDALALAEYQRAVEERRAVGPHEKERLEHDLRLRMVRDTWDHEAERVSVAWQGSAEVNPRCFLATLVMEHLLSELLDRGRRTHIASRRESLCSSWAAAARVLREPAWRDLGAWGEAASHFLETQKLQDPKLSRAVAEIAAKVRRGEKIVVFTHRLETSKVLQQELEKALSDVAANLRRRAKRWAKRGPSVRRALGLSEIADGSIIARLFAQSLPNPSDDLRGLKSWWRQVQPGLIEARLVEGKAGRDVAPVKQLLRSRQLPLIARFDGETGLAQRVHGVVQDPKTLEKFKLPCAPYVLIATSKAQEGIDLHHFCYQVALYDLPWNPAVAEQRIGRVHRIGGLRARGRDKKVLVHYCYQSGTYSEYIKRRVEARCRMMQVLLGAGEWLNNEQEIDALAPYKMSFPAAIKG
jgi:superfamily II DNA or RNA helicase